MRITAKVSESNEIDYHVFLAKNLLKKFPKNGTCLVELLYPISEKSVIGVEKSKLSEKNLDLKLGRTKIALDSAVGLSEEASHCFRYNRLKLMSCEKFILQQNVVDCDLCWRGDEAGSVKEK